MYTPKYVPLYSLEFTNPRKVRIGLQPIFQKATFWTNQNGLVRPTKVVFLGKPFPCFPPNHGFINEFPFCSIKGAKQKIFRGWIWPDLIIYATIWNRFLKAASIKTIFVIMTVFTQTFFMWYLQIELLLSWVVLPQGCRFPPSLLLSESHLQTQPNQKMTRIHQIIIICTICASIMEQWKKLVSKYFEYK